MNNYTREDVIHLVKEEDVEFIRLQFTDIFGTLKNVAITSSQMEKALNNQYMFDGTFIEGFGQMEESDMYLYPDLNSFKIFPWRPQQGKVARLICDVRHSKGQPFEGDPRYILKKVIAEAKEMGYTFQVEPECEFFLFHMDDNGLPTTVTHDRAGYFDLGPLDLGENARRDIVLNLEEMGFIVEASHHEMAPAQHEVDFYYAQALETADNIMTFKLTVKSIAKRHGLHATFMPKPVFGVNGSGMNMNMWLEKNGKNAFFEESDPLELSQDAYSFIAGIMEHIKGMTAITNPLVNSYKRLASGVEAPIYIAWSAANRSSLIRIPAPRGERTKIELCCPDSSCNPYLVLAICLAAGLDGIRKKKRPPKNVEQNICSMTAKERKRLKVESIPQNLKEAIEELQKDRFLQNVLGEHITKKYIEAKQREWMDYQIQVTDWERNQYLLKF